MIKGLLLAVAGLGAGLGIGWWLQPGAPALPSAELRAIAASSRGASAATDASRVASLESALRAEIAERTALEARVQELAASLEELRPGGGAPPTAGVDEREPASDDGPGRQRFRRDALTVRDAGERRQVELLIDAGFAPDRAEWIDRRTSELRMAQLQAQHDATREGRAIAPGAQLAAERTLRSELGDSDYESYLKALGRSTSVPVQSVLASSPAERSGLAPGDEVVAYDGQRVFDMRELNALTLEGNAGESVVVEVRRDGQTVQLVMPRGPIGILGGGFRGGR